MRKIGQFIDSGLLKIFDIDQMHKNSLSALIGHCRI